ncbi:hypothetical protein ALI22I_06870 [Saccharothrix sp. ALI-22-I]|nr:hypothetical protein ALI22I_06870 [Saccharothrix sp. ALI-22-I]
MTAVAATTGRNTADRTNHRERAWPSSSRASPNPVIIDPNVWPAASRNVRPMASWKRSSVTRRV